MWRQQNKGKDLFEETLNDIAKYNHYADFCSLKEWGVGERAHYSFKFIVAVESAWFVSLEPKKIVRMMMSQNAACDGTIYQKKTENDNTIPAPSVIPI